MERGGPQVIPRPGEWSHGRPAPWAEVADPASCCTLDRVAEVLPPGHRGRPSPVADEGGIPSSVLLPLYQGEHGVEVVLTRRAWNLRTHRGEVSFPGGRSEPGETPIHTACREAHEEVALRPELVHPLGELDHLTTVTRRAYIVPVVGVVDGRPELRANEHEVDGILFVPLAELLEPGVFREERWGTGETSRPIYFFELMGDTVWGATAAMLRQLLCRLTGVDRGEPVDDDPARDLPPGVRPPMADDPGVF